MSRRRVILESPYAGVDAEATAQNVAYARECMRDCISRGESPYASHLLLTQVLDDTDKHDRALGIYLGHAWMEGAAAIVVYTDRGISQGMKAGIAHGQTVWHLPVEWRRLREDGR